MLYYVNLVQGTAVSHLPWLIVLSYPVTSLQIAGIELLREHAFYRVDIEGMRRYI